MLRANKCVSPLQTRRLLIIEPMYQRKNICNGHWGWGKNVLGSLNFFFFLQPASFVNLFTHLKFQRTVQLGFSIRRWTSNLGQMNETTFVKNSISTLYTSVLTCLQHFVWIHSVSEKMTAVSKKGGSSLSRESCQLNLVNGHNKWQHCPKKLIYLIRTQG